MNLRILLADDDQIVRTGLKVILNSEPDLEVVGEAADGNEAVALAASMQPDIVVMDIRMPNLDGLKATREIATGSEPEPRVLVLTTFELDAYILDALRAGASGFLLKRASPEEFVEAIRIVAAGDSLLFPRALGQLVSEHTDTGRRSASDDEMLERLTSREREVLLLMAQGDSNQVIAGRLYVSYETTKSHVGSILTKLGVHTRTQAVIAAYESGFVRPNDIV